MGSSHRRRRLRGDRGMVTAEAAVALPALVVLAGLAVSVVALATGQLRCVDAAREAARAVARGEPAAAARALAARAAPQGARITLADSGDTVSVTVTVQVRPLGGLLPAATVQGHAVGVREPGEP